MRLNNYKFVKKIPWIYYFSVIVLLLTIFLNHQLGKQLFPSNTYYYATLIVISLALVYVYFAGKYFEYDSEGSLVVFLNKGAILSEFISYRTKIYEIKREKIKDYKIRNLLIYKRLTVFYSTKNTDRNFRVNISMLSPRKIRFMKLSLDKIIDKNKANL
ncbi:hypothetical protein G3567_09025 [Psychroflexus sp. YR1-1]|uniref:Uncharacterized protein n=1 Tax=Psychroflexus aurantiacus TaxID=2709310 RepID=A0A6B3R9P2_9FLAO|nr:hypothetical protein [Psychroflexus aurantiacus]